MFAGPIGPFGPVPEIGLDCVELVSLTSRLVAGDSIKSLVSTVPYLTNALGDLSFHFLDCVLVSVAFLLHLRVNSWNFLSNSSLINFSLTASMDWTRPVTALQQIQRTFGCKADSKLRFHRTPCSTEM